MPRTRDELDDDIDYRYLNCDEDYIHRDHETDEEVGRSRGNFYGTIDDLRESVLGIRGIVELEIPNTDSRVKTCLVAVGVNVTEEQALTICRQRGAFPI